MGISLLAEHITCVAPPPKKNKRNTLASIEPKLILDNVNLAVTSGQVFAVMGPSGSGKTTLLNILAGRARPPIRDSSSQTPDTLFPGRSKRQMKIMGEIYFNGNKMTSQQAALNSRYVMQKDRLFEYLSVWETLFFAARLKLKTLSYDEVKARCEQILDELGLVACRDVAIGGPLKKGISGGQKKRVAIGVELIDNPALLYLDEPTSGLDSSLAFDVCKILKKLAQSGRTIVATIHQPRSQIFQMFDSLMLLSEGRVAYQGPAHEAGIFTNSIGYPVPTNFNTADFLLDLLTVGNSKSELSVDYIKRSSKLGSRLGSRRASKASDADVELAHKALNVSPPNLGGAPSPSSSFIEDGRIFIEESELRAIPDKFEKSKWGQKVHQEVEMIKKKQEVLPLPPVTCLTSAFTMYWYGVGLLMVRHFKNKGRNPMATFLKLTVTLVMSLINGLLFWQLTKPENALDCKNFYDYLGAVAFVCLNLSFGSINHTINFPGLRPQYNREVAGKLYSPSAFHIAYNLADLVFIALDPILLTLVVYFMVGYGNDAGRFFFFMLTGIVVTVAAVGWGMVAGCFSPNEAVIGALGPVGTVFAALTSGFWITEDDLPAFWYVFSFISWIRYGLNALMQSLFRDVGVIENCFGVTRSTGQWAYLGYGLLLAIAFRLVAYLGLRFTNTRIGMEG